MTALFVVCAAVGGTALVVQFLLRRPPGGRCLGDRRPPRLCSRRGRGRSRSRAGADAHGDGPHDDPPTTIKPNWHDNPTRARPITARRGCSGALAADGRGRDDVFRPGGHGRRRRPNVHPSRRSPIAIAAGLPRCMPSTPCSRHAPLHAEGTVQIRRAVGKEAAVYLRIPGQQRSPERSRSTSKTGPWNTWERPPARRSPPGLCGRHQKYLGADTASLSAANSAIAIRRAAPLARKYREYDHRKGTPSEQKTNPHGIVHLILFPARRGGHSLVTLTKEPPCATRH